MNFFSISGLLIGISCASMAMWVYASNKSNIVNKLWAIFCVSVAIWGFGGLVAGLCKDPISARDYWRIAYIGVIFIPSLFYHFVTVFLSEKRKISVLWIYAISLFFLFADSTDLMIPDTQFLFNQLYFLKPPGLVYPYFVFFFFFMVVYSHIKLWKYMRVSRDASRKIQVRWFFMATIVGFSGGSTCFLPTFGINLYPYGNLTVPLYPVIMSYAIVKHRLMDIDVVIKRTAVFAGLFAFVYGIFTAITILGQEFFRSSLGWNQWISMIPTVGIITFTLRPLENFLTNATERFLFQKKYNYRDLLKTFTNDVLSVIDFERLPRETVSGLSRIMKLESAYFFIQDKDKKIFRIVSQMGAEKISTLPMDELLLECLAKHRGPIIRSSEIKFGKSDEPAQNLLAELSAQIFIPIVTADEFIGVLCLGAKKSGSDYTEEDVDILSALGRTLAIAISNAKLFDELSKTQAEAAQREKMAVIGTLAAGINHEICNPLGIVRGNCEMFLLNSKEGFLDDVPRDELIKMASETMAKVIKETDRATSITRKLSNFAKPSKANELEYIDISTEVDEVMGLLGHDLKLSNIEFEKDFQDNFPTILADRKQIQEIFFNIIRNAAQAMDKQKGKISTSGRILGDSIIIKLKDNGSGIPEDKLDQIFHPFYTTKQPGKGTGLGLFIVKQVVEKNKGTINVESQQGQGTLFTLVFPKADKLVQKAA